MSFCHLINHCSRNSDTIQQGLLKIEYSNKFTRTKEFMLFSSEKQPILALQDHNYMTYYYITTF